MASVAVYTRLSRDESGQQTATARQEAACRAFAEARGWTVAAVFEDVDVSAYRPVSRPGFDLLQQAVKGGRIDGVLVWKLDRLVRRSAEFEVFWALCERAKVFLASTTEPVDSSNELGMTVVRILVAFAHMESATTSLRIKAREKEAALRGEPRLRGKTFGYTADMTEIVDAEAALIREAADRVLDGASLRSIAADWTCRGIPTLRGSPAWSSQTIRQFLLSPRIAGKREYCGEIVAQGQWPAILDELTFARLRECLCAEDRRSQAKWRPQALLSRGILRCGRCGNTLKSGVRRNGQSIYVCTHRPYGCTRISVGAVALDEFVVDQVLGRAEAGAELSVGPLDEAAELIALRELASLDTAAAQAHRDYYVDRNMRRDEYLTIHQALVQRRARLRRDLGLRRLASLATSSVRDSWEQWPVTRRRMVLRSMIDHIDIGAYERSKYDDPIAHRVTIHWALDRLVG